MTELLATSCSDACGAGTQSGFREVLWMVLDEFIVFMESCRMGGATVMHSQLYDPIRTSYSRGPL